MSTDGFRAVTRHLKEKEELKFTAFIIHCLDTHDIDAICSLKDYKEMTENLMNDGFLGAAE